MTQGELVEKCGTSKSYISKIENNIKEVRISTLQKIVELGLHYEITKCYQLYFQKVLLLRIIVFESKNYRLLETTSIIHDQLIIFIHHFIIKGIKIGLSDRLGFMSQAFLDYSSRNSPSFSHLGIGMPDMSYLEVGIFRELKDKNEIINLGKNEF